MMVAQVLGYGAHEVEQILGVSVSAEKLLRQQGNRSAKSKRAFSIMRLLYKMSCKK